MSSIVQAKDLRNTTEISNIAHRGRLIELKGLF